jgi:hypothetical protein
MAGVTVDRRHLAGLNTNQTGSPFPVGLGPRLLGDGVAI